MIWNIPNTLSLARLLVFLPALWILAICGRPVWLGAILALALLTDAADGYLARSCHQVTSLGARLDSMADQGIVASAVVWLLMLRPEVLLGRAGLMLTLSLGLSGATLAIGWIRFRRLANLHLYSHKVAAVIGGVFLVVCFVSGFQHWLFYLASGASAVSNAEAIALLLTRDSVDEHMGSILRSARRPVSGRHSVLPSAHEASRP